MNAFQRIAALSPFPLVDLTHPELPTSGIVIQTPSTCSKNFLKGDACRRHYEQIAKSEVRSGELVQCPFGFASAPFRTDNLFAAFTSLIPFPRIGGSKESVLAKRHRECRVATTGTATAIAAVVGMDNQFQAIEKGIFKGHSMALHEIRKLNRAIKQNAERLCRTHSPTDLEKAPKELVTIYKSSELMSNEFDVIEVLADASQAALPLNTVSELYRVFDKCVRIYNTQAGGRRVVIRSSVGGYSPRIAAHDKTLHIIPSVLIENSLKYSSPGSETRILFEPDGEESECIVRVVNESDGRQELDDRVFQRGFRFDTRQDGSGNGLYVAQLIAKQHHTRITVQSQIVGPNSVRHIFEIRFKTTTDKWLKKGK